MGFIVNETLCVSAKVVQYIASIVEAKGISKIKATHFVFILLMWEKKWWGNGSRSFWLYFRCSN